MSRTRIGKNGTPSAKALHRIFIHRFADLTLSLCRPELISVDIENRLPIPVAEQIPREY